ncbi:MAG: hypothetical protein EBR82_61025 [Caulobacteraceae bacterium]|nr:hypothetical protein [Caulobacteraceae bacterium]
MAAKVILTEGKVPLSVTKQYFVSAYHGGYKNIQDSKKLYFELIEQNAFEDIANKRSRQELYISFIESPILEGGLGSTINDFEYYFRDELDVLDKHRELINPGKGGDGSNQYTFSANTNNVSICKIKRNIIHGNRVDYSIDRLNKSGHVELANKVIAKEISANAAMVQVGFRKPTIIVKKTPDDFIRVINKLFDKNTIEYIINKITKQ